ncbi:MAG: DUF2181 domain-containing protein [Pseudomonadaceae bacterium]|nr:DUF2181 domain-containing protein [Pseudomonadaceae bacterium]
MQSIAHYFGLADTADLAWAHSVHSRTYLEESCNDATLHMLQGEVHFAAEDALPCVAHAWQDIADMDVATWAAAIIAAGKGLKIHFADAAAVEPTLSVLQRLKPDTPVMLHADIFTLLPSDDSEGLEPEQFVRLCQQYCPKAVISIGWSLKREADADGRMEEVLIHQISDMALKRLGPVNYAIEIHAGYTSGWERGAALVFDPLPETAPAASAGGANVVNAGHLFRRSAA